MSGERKKPGRAPNKADRDLFRRVMTDVRPLGDEGEPEPGSEPGPKAGRPKGSRPSVPRPRAPSLPQLAIGAAAGIDARTLTRLKRGRIPPEARLDLHGMTLDAAHAAISGFIERCAGRGLRCVIVITGKGRVGQDSGTIRSELAHWLNQDPTRARILAFAEARPQDGGAGARYILLRRKVRAKP